MADNPDRPAVSRYQTFTPERVHRRSLSAAPYNPRRPLTDDEKGRLRGVLERHGLFNALVWNRRTGRLVAGHQRLSLLDALEGSDDYYMDVDAVDVEEAQERAMNVAHNNQAAAGDYDLEKLAGLFRDEAVRLDIDSTGFNPSDLYRLLGDSPFTGESAAELEKLAERVREFGDQINAGHADAVAKYDPNFYTVLVWRDTAARDAAHAEFGWDNNRYQDGRRLLTAASGQTG